MRTTSENKPIASSLFGKTRRSILALLFTHPGESFYLREIARLTGLGRGSVERELANLAESGIIVRESRGREVYFRANELNPIFNALKTIMVRTAGVADVLRESLSPLADKIDFAFIYGSFADGSEKPSSDIDLMVVGSVDEMALHKAVGSAESSLGREIHYSLLKKSELVERLKDKKGFTARVMEGLKIEIVGEVK